MPTLLVLVLLLSPTVHGSEALTVSPESAFQKESTAMTFRLPMKAAPSGLLLLVQTDENGQILREIGPMTDDGVMGDSEKNDLTYSRRIHVNEKKATRLYFGVIQAANQNAGSSAGKAPGKAPTKADVFTSVEILDRPTFTELITQIWGKVKTAL